MISFKDLFARLKSMKRVSNTRFGFTPEYNPLVRPEVRRSFQLKDFAHPGNENAPDPEYDSAGNSLLTQKDLDHLTALHAMADLPEYEDKRETRRKELEQNQKRSRYTPKFFVGDTVRDDHSGIEGKIVRFPSQARDEYWPPYAFYEQTNHLAPDDLFELKTSDGTRHLTTASKISLVSPNHSPSVSDLAEFESKRWDNDQVTQKAFLHMQLANKKAREEMDKPPETDAFGNIRVYQSQHPEALKPKSTYDFFSDSPGLEHVNAFATLDAASDVFSDHPISVYSIPLRHLYNSVEHVKGGGDEDETGEMLRVAKNRGLKGVLKRNIWGHHHLLIFPETKLTKVGEVSPIENPHPSVQHLSTLINSDGEGPYPTDLIDPINLPDRP